jgi:hypothetical protein
MENSMNKVEEIKGKLLREWSNTIDLFEELRFYTELGQFVSNVKVTDNPADVQKENCIFISDERELHYVRTLIKKIKNQEGTNEKQKSITEGSFPKG